MQLLKTVPLFTAVVLVSLGCEVKEMISEEDLIAVQGMKEELAVLHDYHDSLEMAEGELAHYYDSLIEHHHDIFWHHHQNYSHMNEFDDHNHDVIQGGNHHMSGSHSMNMHGNCPCHNGDNNYHIIDHHYDMDSLEHHHQEFHD